MQEAKDTFLMVLRDRLAQINPARVVAVRGALRPAVLAGENELQITGDPADCFVLQWLESTRDTSEPLPLQNMRCEIRYSTGGVPEFSGLDRGRVLTAMHGELRRMLEPRSAALVDYTVAPASVGLTRLFWSDAKPAVVTAKADRLQAVSQLTVYALEEAAG